MQAVLIRPIANECCVNALILGWVPRKRCLGTALGNQVLNDPAMNVGQPKISA